MWSYRHLDCYCVELDSLHLPRPQLVLVCLLVILRSIILPLTYNAPFTAVDSLQQVPFHLQAGLILSSQSKPLGREFRIGRCLDSSSCCLCGCCFIVYDPDPGNTTWASWGVIVASSVVNIVIDIARPGDSDSFVVCIP